MSANYYGTKVAPDQVQLGALDHHGFATFVYPDDPRLTHDEDRVERIVKEAYATRNRENGDPIQELVRQAVRIALSDAAKLAAS